MMLNLAMEATLPTGFVFDFGANRPKFHGPVKTSTRERVIQVGRGVAKRIVVHS
jgi:hypothetical protein